MPGMAEFNPEPSRNAMRIAPSEHALELGKAWYALQEGEIHPFVAKELSAMLLFSHVFQAAGCSGLRFVRSPGAHTLVRNRTSYPILIGEPGTAPYTVTLKETAYQDPVDQTWRGITPELGFKDENGVPVFFHTRQPMLALDWVARGPFLPVSPGAKWLTEMSSDFMGFINDVEEELETPFEGLCIAMPDDLAEAMPWEEQRWYVEELEKAAGILAIGRPEIALEHATEFIAPENHRPETRFN